MLRMGTTAGGAGAKTLHKLEFRGSGSEYFGIWIVNLALTVATLGIYSAWAKVRTMRYFRGNTYLAGHPFDYHASPVRILIGRIIAVSVLLGYGVTARLHPLAVVAWAVFFLFITPWLLVSSMRFNARNTSYRSVRFNFVGTLAGAALVYIFWPALSLLSLFTTWPLVHRARDYYFVNNHTFGGKPFHTQFSIWSIYGIYLIAVVAFFAMAAGVATLFVIAALPLGLYPASTQPSPAAILAVLVSYLVIFFVLTAMQVFVHAMTMNLALNNASLDGRHELRSSLGPVRLAWIVATNTILTLLSLGLFYPWASVRLARYEISKFAVLAASDLDEFTSEVIATQGAIGEEIATFFDLGISL
jgi:uncharacterized membrane protein YjgN (DUF898 family)